MKFGFLRLGVLTIAVLSFALFIKKANSNNGPTWPAQGTKILAKADLANCDCAQLELLRNEIFARHGKKFKREDLQKHFESQPWYKFDPKNPDGSKSLNSFEKKNAATIANMEKETGCSQETKGDTNQRNNSWIKNETIAGIKL